MKLTKSQREELRMKFGGKCAYCGCELPEKGWQADHVEPVWRYTKRTYETVPAGSPPEAYFQRECREEKVMGSPERDTIENLVPSCRQCNNYKMAMSLETFRQQIGRQIEMLRSYSMNFRTAERYGMVQIVEKPVVFWFEQYTPAPKPERVYEVGA